MANPNFSSLLDRPSTEIKRPPPYPLGTYLWVVHGLPRQDKSSKKQTDFVEFMLNCLQAQEDVDQTELAEFGGIAGKSTKLTFYITEAAQWRLSEFLDNLGLPRTNESGESFTDRERIDASPGCQVYGKMGHEASEDGKSIYSKIVDTAKVD